MKEKLIPINPSPDGICRTIKSQYWKTSAANFLYSGTYGATGVLVVFDDEVEKN